MCDKIALSFGPLSITTVVAAARVAPCGWALPVTCTRSGLSPIAITSSSSSSATSSPARQALSWLRRPTACRPDLGLIATSASSSARSMRARYRASPLGAIPVLPVPIPRPWGRCEHRWYRCRARPGSGVDHFEADALVALALALGFDDSDAADLAGGVHVRAAVGLLVEPDDVDHPDLRHRLGDHRDLGADQVLVHHGRRAGQERNLDRAVRGQFVVDELLDSWAEALRQWVELEVHPGAQ